MHELQKTLLACTLIACMLAGCQRVAPPVRPSPAHVNQALVITPTTTSAPLTITVTTLVGPTRTITSWQRNTPTPTRTPTPTLALPGFPFTMQIKQTVIFYATFPGDGGWCLANYLGYTAPAFVLYSDGQLLIHNPPENPWYAEKMLSKMEMDALLESVQQSGFLSVQGDGSQYEDDPIYQLPEGVEHYYGPGSSFFKVIKDDQVKQVSIMDIYRLYLVPEITAALDVILDYHPQDLSEYQPDTWVVLFDDEDPCGIPFDYRPWPDGMPDVSPYLSPVHGAQLVFQNSVGINYTDALGTKPQPFILQTDGVDYYVFSRPLLPHEKPSDFPVY